MRFTLAAFVLIITALLAWGRPLGEGEIQRRVPPFRWQCTFPNGAKTTLYTVEYINAAVEYAAYKGDKEPWKVGKSGYPHTFDNSEGLKWGIEPCEVDNVVLWEFPIFDDNKTLYNKDVKRSSIDASDNTPYRVVYTDSDGAATVCGVMVHENQEKDEYQGGWRGKGDFQMCGNVV